jgi:hypothetical protein
MMRAAAIAAHDPDLRRGEPSRRQEQRQEGEERGDRDAEQHEEHLDGDGGPDLGTRAGQHRPRR